MNKEHNNENKNDEEDTLTLAKLFSNWYVGAVVGFALGTLKGDLTTASIGLVIATVSWIFKKCLMSEKKSLFVNFRLVLLTKKMRRIHNE